MSTCLEHEANPDDPGYSIPTDGDCLPCWRNRATRAEDDAHWNLRSSRLAKEGRIRANARIRAAVAILNEDTRWQDEEHLLARVRQALTA